MPITLSNRDLLDSLQPMRKVSDMQVPVRTALKLRKILKSAQSEVETLQDQLKALAKKHARRELDEDGKIKIGEDGEEVLARLVIKDADGKPVIGDDGKPKINENAYDLEQNLKAYNKDIEDLLEEEIELPFEPIKAEDLSDKPDPKKPLAIPELKIETSLLYALHWLITD